MRYLINTYSESLSRTLTYKQHVPGCRDLRVAITHEHLHNAIRFVTPQQRHTDQDIEILAERKRVHQQAKSNNPICWSRKIRNWEPIKEAQLTSEKDKAEIEEN